MRKYLIYIFTASTIVLASCSSNDETSPTLTEPIAVAAAISDQMVSSRAAYSLTTPTTEKPLAAAVWVSTTPHSYPGSQTAISEEATSIDYHNTATFTGASKQLLSTQMYYISHPDDKVQVYLIGLYPQTGWKASSSDSGTSNIASYTFTGKEDVMYAPEVSNSLSTSSQYPTLQFGHLLTWLRIYAYAESEAIANAWGKITSITVSSENTVAVNTNGNTKTFSSSQNLNTYLTGTDDALSTTNAVAIGTKSTEIAYVLCAPVTATNTVTDGVSSTEYTLTINTENRHNISVPVNLTSSANSDFTGDTAGHQFSITLKFVQGDNILTSATYNDWENGGNVIVPVEK